MITNNENIKYNITYYTIKCVYIKYNTYLLNYLNIYKFKY